MVCLRRWSCLLKLALCLDLVQTPTPDRTTTMAMCASTPSKPTRVRCGFLSASSASHACKENNKLVAQLLA